MTESSDKAMPGTDDADGQRWSRRTFSPEVVERAHEKIRGEQAKRRRRLFGDRRPFAVPEDDMDVDFDPDFAAPPAIQTRPSDADPATGTEEARERPGADADATPQPAKAAPSTPDTLSILRGDATPNEPPPPD